MEQQKTKILIISIALLIIGLIGGWIFVVSNMLNNPETSKNTADIQQKQATGEKSKQNNSGESITNTGSGTLNTGSISTGSSEPIKKKSDNQQSLSQRSFRLLLPPGHDITTRKRMVKQIYSQSRIIAIPYLASSLSDYEEQRKSGDFSIILDRIGPNTNWEHTTLFKRSEELVSFFHASSQSWSGAFTHFIPFAIDPLVLLVHREKVANIPLDALAIEKILNDPYTIQSNYIVDRMHLIRKKQQKSSYHEYSDITDILLSQALYHNNSDLLRLFLRLSQFSSVTMNQTLQELSTNEIRCESTSALQCLAITQEPPLLWGWLSDILSSNLDLQNTILSRYTIASIPTLQDAYPVQGRGWVITTHDTTKTALAQEWITTFITSSLEGQYNLRPQSFSAYQKMLQQEKYEEKFSQLKHIFGSNLELIPSDQSFHINTELLQVVEGSYNSDIWLRQEKKKISDL